MLALPTALRLYAEAGLSFEAALGTYARLGHVVIAPDRILLWRPVWTNHPGRWLEPGSPEWAEADAWFVGLLVGGSIAWALAQMPHARPWLCWYRRFRNPRDGLHLYPTAQWLARCSPPKPQQPELART